MLHERCREIGRNPDDILQSYYGAFSVVRDPSQVETRDFHVLGGTPEQVAGYVQLLDRVVSGGVVYLKQWKRWHNPVDELTLEFGNYPIPARWHELYNRFALVQTGFQEAAWRL